MKTLHLLLLFLIFCSCSSNSQKDKFFGKWKKSDLDTKAYIEIKNDAGAIIVHEVKSKGTKSFVGVFDKENNIIVVDVIFAKINISYLESKDRILISKQGEYERIK